MRGASRDSLAAARERLEAGSADHDPLGLADELFAAADTCDSSPSLRAALTAPAAEADAKAALTADVFGEQYSAAAVDLLSSVARSRWSNPREFVDALDILGVQAVVTSAENHGVLEQVESDLFQFGQIVTEQVALRAALTDRSVPSESRAELAAGLLEGRTSEETRRLVVRVVGHPRGLSFESAMQSVTDEVAQRRQRRVATVVTAISLTDVQRQRLVAALAAKFASQIYLNVIVDPDVIGGLRVSVGDQVIDGTIANRLDEARQRLIG